MNHNDVIRYLIVCYPEGNFPSPTQQVYMREFADTPSEAFLAAARWHVNHSPYPKIPTIGELRNALNEVRRAQAALPDPFQAWGEAVRELTRHRPTKMLLCAMGEKLFQLAQEMHASGAPDKEYWGQIAYYDEHIRDCPSCHMERDPLSFSTPLIGATLEALQMTRIDGDNEGVQRAHFVKAYEQMVKREADFSLPMLGDGNVRDQ